MNMQTPNSRWRIKNVEGNDSSLVRSQFKKIFDQNMSQQHWQWKYAQGRGQAIVALVNSAGNQFAAHYGGVGRDIIINGTAEKAVQIVDVMVAPEERGSLSRQGPFFRVAASFLEQYIGYNKAYLLGFGFPNDRAMRLAQSLGLYEPVGEMAEFTWSPLAKIPSLSTHLLGITIKNVQRYAAQLDGLWQQMQACFTKSIIGVRDWQYINHRYLRHPVRNYEIIMVIRRFTQKPLGLIVLRHEEEKTLLLDIVAAKVAAESAAAYIGINKIDFWAKKDRQLALTDKLVTSVSQAIVNSAANTVFFPSPMELHPDHRAAAQLVWRALYSLAKNNKQSATLIASYSYEITVQSQLNQLIDISSVIEQKKRAMALYRSQIKKNNYIDVVLALNKTRTLTLPKTIQYAEGFYAYSDAERNVSFESVVKGTMSLYWQ